MQEKTQLLPDDLVRLTLLVRRRVYFFTPSFPSSCHAVMSFFSTFLFFVGAVGAAGRDLWKVNHSAVSNKSTGTEGSDT